MKVLKFERLINILLWKRYFDTGLGVTSYAKYIIALFGLYSISENISLRFTLFLAVVWMLSCFFIGWAWLKFDLYRAEQEISNRFNPFVHEVRAKIVKSQKTRRLEPKRKI